MSLLVDTAGFHRLEAANPAILVEFTFRLRFQSRLQNEYLHVLIGIVILVEMLGKSTVAWSFTTVYLCLDIRVCSVSPVWPT